MDRNRIAANGKCRCCHRIITDDRDHKMSCTYRGWAGLTIPFKPVK